MMDEEEALQRIMVVREAFMVSPAGDSKPTLRNARFLNPIISSDAKSTDHHVSDSNSKALSSSFSAVPPVFEPKNWPMKIETLWWRSPPKKWVHWLDTLYPKYASMWKKVGILDALMSTKCNILKTNSSMELYVGVAEKWCPETNTFVFPWGEATITLEDVMVLGGYPVIGGPGFTARKDEEMKYIEEKLISGRKEAGRSKQNKASMSAWMGVFMDSGKEIEHEAFLAAWLSTFVFPNGDLIAKSVFRIAIQLARGVSIALAPAVLASIYRDLDLLKKAIVGVKENKVVEKDVKLQVTLRSPFHLVQVWVWERFKNLQPPQPKVIKSGEPIVTRWHEVKPAKLENVRAALNSSVDHFLWRPYARLASGKYKVFYPEHEKWIQLGKDSDSVKELEAYASCLRVSELVGFGSDSIVKQYLPNRVALQFGLDQDIPACVQRLDKSEAMAWENYCRPISERKLYFPSRLFEADVTSGYAEWWKNSVLCNFDPAIHIAQHKKRAGFSNIAALLNKAKRKTSDAEIPDVPPGFAPKNDRKEAEGNCDADVPAHKVLNAANSSEDCGATTRHPGKLISDEEGKNLSSSAASTADYGAAGEPLQQKEKVVIILDDDSESEPSMVAMEEDFSGENGTREQEMSSEKVNHSGNEDEGHGYSSDLHIMVQVEERIRRLENQLATVYKTRKIRHI
ncbi:uncharacterized protein LOC107479053 [Arachis duranensis]|uniref:Uncharacterized protein LOC107479053 n=1 Tax=Arachis duranensis TaxID=130453 RepID=A0A6P4CNP1_ARADU|nr:uncharacterized protein LOC107479053 [Arachis duranensis]